ncbi:hypothetical protein PMAC_001746 [Pneumocystis sp. 'macacae']|nr:hypothetical protein PMAC_001746 [Pneumocystis sp. 'macacae']
MHFNSIIFSVLALLNLISARLHVISPSVDSVWKYGTVYTVQWKVKDPGNYGYSGISLYLVCLHDTSTRVISTIVSDLNVAHSSYAFTAPHISDCESYLVKFVLYNHCGLKNTFFSSSFFITSDGKPHKTVLTQCDGEKTVPPKEKPTPESKPGKSNETVHETAKDSASRLPPPSSQAGPTPTGESQTYPLHKPTPGETQEPRKPDGPAITKPKEPSSPTTSKDKNGDIENSSSTITYKFFGIILGTIVAFICS